MTLGTYFLDQNEPQKTVELLLSEENSLSIAKRVLLARAYECKNQIDESEKTVKDIFDYTRDSILNYTCKACQESLNEWSGNCPQCNTWDSIVQGPLLNGTRTLKMEREKESTKEST